MSLILPMSTIITIILLICGYLALIQSVNAISRQSLYSSGNLLLIDILIAVMYIGLCGVVALLYISSGYNPFVIYLMITIGVVVMALSFIRFCWKNRIDMRKIHVVLFLVYFAIVLYLTIFMRIGSVDTSVITTPFDDLRNAIQYRDMSLVQHMVWNVVLFVPFGYLIPSFNPDKFGKASFAFLGGIVCSAVIEGIQMIFRIGQSDIDDIIANSIGAVLGYMVFRLVWRIQKNWKL
ncbi:MAG: VanZ family protein [Lachnospiraceae bacterium]